MLSRISAFVIWALVAATLVFWALRLTVRSAPPPLYAVAVDTVGAGRADLARVLGSTPTQVAAAQAAPEVSSRFKLIGIMAPRVPAGQEPARSGGGVALIAVDGKPPKAYRVGAPVDDQLVLQSVSLRTASIGPAEGDAAVRLELPPLAAAATGSLPPPEGVIPSNPPAGRSAFGPGAPMSQPMAPPRRDPVGNPGMSGVPPTPVNADAVPQVVAPAPRPAPDAAVR